MKRVNNVSKPWFPRKGEIIRRIIEDSYVFEVMDIVGKCWKAGTTDCKQDTYCNYCLKLRDVRDPTTRTGQHCFNDPLGRCHWLKVGDINEEG